MTGLSGFTSFVIRLCQFRSAMRRGQTQSGSGALDQRFVAGHWTSAASRDSYAETSRLILDASVLAIVLAGTTTALVVGSQWDNAHKVWSSSPKQQEVLIRICCTSQVDEWDTALCSARCRMGHAGLSTMLTATVGLLSILVASLVFIPTQLWSPITFQAVTKTRDTQMRRLLKLPIPTAIFMACNVSGFVLYSYSFLGMPGIETPALWEAALYLCLLLFCSELLVLLWVAPWRRILESTKETVCAIKALSSQNYAIWPSEEPDEQIHTQRRGFWKCRECASYRQSVLLFCVMYSFGVSVITESGTSAYHLWLLRIVTLLFIVFTRDKPVDFGALCVSGAAFGLTINARQLRAAILSHLAGKQYKGQVHRYKASFLRMADTMAVSYRWSSDVVTVSEGLSINMTEWQLGELVKAIDRSKCLYVWLDSCSVPQHIHDLKNILLSRMMAVYASAFVTLVLVSRERDTERYHEVRSQFCAMRGHVPGPLTPAPGITPGPITHNTNPFPAVLQICNWRPLCPVNDQRVHCMLVADVDAAGVLRMHAIHACHRGGAQRHGSGP